MACDKTVNYFMKIYKTQIHKTKYTAYAKWKSRMFSPDYLSVLANETHSRCFTDYNVKHWEQVITNKDPK